MPSPPRRPLSLIACLPLLGYAACGSGKDPGSPSAGDSGSPGSRDGGASSGASSGAANGQVAGFSNGALADAGRRTYDGGACATKTEQAEQIPANLLFVIDKSGSMSCCPPPVTDSSTCESFPEKTDCSRSKWEITRDALVDVMSELGTLGNVSAGITLFPRDGQCAVADSPDIAIQSLDDEHLSRIDDFLSNEVSPGGSTPIVGATTLSYAHLQAAFGNRLLRENTFVVLVTDGRERCTEDQIEVLFDTNVPNARRINVRTFVIGAPGSEGARNMLSRLAFEGGTARSPSCTHGPEPMTSEDAGLALDADAGSGTAAGGYCHFDMTESVDFSAELREALAQISQSRELSCELDVPANPSGGGVDLEKVNVTFTPTDGEPAPILQDATKPCGSGADGWQYAESDTKIVLCGATCDRVRADRQGEIEIVLGCPTEKVKLQ